MLGGFISSLLADRCWLTIWHGDCPDNTLLGLVPEVTGQRFGLPRHTRRVTVGYLAVPLIALESWLTASR